MFHLEPLEPPSSQTRMEIQSRFIEGNNRECRREDCGYYLDLRAGVDFRPVPTPTGIGMKNPATDRMSPPAYFSAKALKLANPDSNCGPTMRSVLKNRLMTFATYSCSPDMAQVTFVVSPCSPS